MEICPQMQMGSRYCLNRECNRVQSFFRTY